MKGPRRAAMHWLAPALVVSAVLGGCQPFYDPTASGESAAHNWSVHVINPEPTWPAGPPPLDGRRAALVMKRYETGEVIKPVQIDTQSR